MKKVNRKKEILQNKSIFFIFFRFFQEKRLHFLKMDVSYVTVDSDTQQRQRLIKIMARGSSSTGQSATLSRWMLRVRVPSLSPFFLPENGETKPQGFFTAQSATSIKRRSFLPHRRFVTKHHISFELEILPHRRFVAKDY